MVITLFALYANIAAAVANKKAPGKSRGFVVIIRELLQVSCLAVD